MSRRLLLILSSITVFFAAFLVYLNTDVIKSGSDMNYEDGKEYEEGYAEEGEESPEVMKLYFQQRLYGNPDVDISQRVWNTYSELLASPQLSLNKHTIGNRWESMGPTNIAGRIRALAMHPSEPNTIYAGAASGGVWKSTNMGVDWISLTDNLPALSIGAIAIDPNNPNRIFAGTGEPVALTINTHGNASPSYLGNGVIKTEDGGQTWTVIPWPSSTSAVHRIALHPESADTFFVATLTDLYKTTNGGNDWTKVQSGIITDVIFKPGNPSIVFCAIGRDYGGSSNGVYISEQSGDRYTWKRLSTNFPVADSCGRIVLSISPANPDRIYAAVAHNRNRKPAEDNDFYVLMVSPNGGETWERKNNAISTSFTRNQAYYDLAIGVSPTDPNYVFLGGIDCWRSTNGGTVFFKLTDWSLRTTNPNSPKYVHADQHAFCFKPDDSKTILVGCDGGIHVSTDQGVNWTNRSNSLVTTQYYSCNYDNTKPAMYYGGTQDQSNQRQNSPGDTRWSFVGGGDGGCMSVDPTNNGIIYYAINAEPYRTLNGGGSSQRIADGLNGGSIADRMNWRRPMYLHPADRTLLYTASQYVYQMKQANSSPSPRWEIISPNLSRSSSIVSDLVIAPTNPDWMYAVSGDGKAWVCKNVRSLDPLWEDISSGLPNKWFSNVTVDWNNHEIVYVAVSGFGAGHAFRSTNAGKNWTNITGDLPDLPAGAIVPSRTNPNVVFLATDLGVWHTTNGGTNWKQYGTDLPNVVAYDMKLTPENVLVCGTYGRGIWVTSAILSAEGNNIVKTPAVFSLEQNYPNPFNPKTQVPFTLPMRSHVTLKVYNIRGEHIKTLVNEIRESGSHTVTFDADEISSGTYLYTIESGSMKQIRKMVIVK